MRFWTTIFSLLSTGCLVAPAVHENEAELDPSGSASDTGPTEGEDDGNDDGGFVPKNDVPPDPNACDPMSPDCDPGEKCTMVAIGPGEWDGTCVPIAEQTVAVGERCVPLDDAGRDNCEAGAVCWDIMDGEGTCLGYCAGTPDEPECDEGFICNWGKSMPAGLCTPVCDPLSTEECPETCGCYWTNNNFFCLPRTSDIAVGEPCGFVNDCAPLSFCMAAEALPDCAGTACCSAWCDINDGSECGPSTACTAFFEQGAAPPDYEHVGICIDPDSLG